MVTPPRSADAPVPDSYIIRPRYLLDEHGQVVENAALRVVGGVITEMDRADRVSGAPVHDAGDVILLPGLVNAHTHLELGFAANRVPPSPDFTGWLHALLDEILATASDATVAGRSVAAGLDSALAGGVTLLGDITRQPSLTRATIANVDRRPAVVSFGEVIAIGRLRETAERRIADAVQGLAERVPDIWPAISPHAPYTVEEEVLRRCVAEGRRPGQRLCMHAAETEAEEQFTRRGAGPLRDYLEKLEVWDGDIPIPGCGPIEWLDRCGVLGSTTLLAHCNYVSDADMDRLARTGTHVAYCPRTHAAFGHAPHRFRDMLARGVNVCLGTDSLASSPSLSILDEMRFLHQEHPDLAPAEILRMATRNGAAALGQGDQAGVLAPGRRLAFAAIDLHAGPNDPLASVLTAPSAEPVDGRRPAQGGWTQTNFDLFLQ